MLAQDAAAVMNRPDPALAVVLPPSPAVVLGMAEVIGALSYALDLTEGQLEGHCVRCCWMGMQIGQRLGLDQTQLSDLYYTILLKDSGCSSNAGRLWELYGGDERMVKHAYKTVDSRSFAQLGRFVLKHAGPGEGLRARIQRIINMARNGEQLATELIHTRCERGANIARRIGFSDDVGAGIFALDEHWNGQGHPQGLVGEAIPMGARIALLAQVVDVFNTASGRDVAIEEARRRSGGWFDPRVVDAFLAISDDDAFWAMLNSAKLDASVRALEPIALAITVDEDKLDVIADAFADIIDAKSSFTSGHSRRVTEYSDGIAAALGLPPARRRWLRRAALLHDIGKLGVSNSILEKNGKLDQDEWEAVRQHAGMSEAILQRISIFRDLAPVAGAHHERLDGTGYPRRLQGDEITLEARIIAVADVFDAITAKRPYRDGMPFPDALALMDRDRDTALDASCLDALRINLNLP